MYFTESSDTSDSGGSGSGESNSGSLSSWMGTPIGTMISIGVGFFLFAILLLCCYHFVIRKKRDVEDYDGEELPMAQMAEMQPIPTHSPMTSSSQQADFNDAQNGFVNQNNVNPRGVGGGQLPNLQGQVVNMQAAAMRSGMMMKSNEGNNNIAMTTMNTNGAMNPYLMNTMGMNGMNTLGNMPMNTMGGVGGMQMNANVMNVMNMPMNPNLTPQQQLAMRMQLLQQLQQQQMMQQTQGAVGMGPGGTGPQLPGAGAGVGADGPGMAEKIDLPDAPAVQATPGGTYQQLDDDDDEDEHKDENNANDMNVGNVAKPDPANAAAPPGPAFGMPAIMPIVGGNGGAETTGAGGGHIGEANSRLSGWQDWDSTKVTQWLSFELSNNYGLDSKDEQEQVLKFINEFEKQNVNGKMLQKIKQDKNNEYLKFLQSNFTDQSAGLWIAVKDAVNDLP